MKETVKGRALVSMDALVQQTESPFIAEVLHFPLPAKFRMPKIETFDGTKDPVNHLNTYKNHMELNRYQDLVRCRAFAITLKGPTLAWFNRLPPSSISSFRELSIAFVSHFIGARTYRKPSYHFIANHKAEPTEEPEVLRPKVQCIIVKGRHPRREVFHHRFHRRARRSVERPDVFHLKKPSGKHG